MMLFKKAVLLLSLCLSVMQAMSQADSTVFNISPKVIHPGTTISIRYNASKTPLAGKANINCVAYQYHSNFTWSVQDVMLVKKDSTWHAQLTLADNCSLVLCSFSNDTITDNGKASPYVAMLAENNGGKMAQGSFFAWGTMRNAFLQKTMPFTLDTASFKDNEVTRMWIRYELQYHPESRPYVFKTSFALYSQNKNIAEITDNVYKELASILQMPNLTEQVWIDAKEVYGNILKDKKSADSLEQLILEKFPNGVVARDKVIQYLYTREKDAIKQAKGFEEMLVKFPPANFTNVHTFITDLYYSKSFRIFIYPPIIKDSNYNLLYKYLPIIPYDELSTFYYHLVEIPHEKKQISAAVCLHLSTLIYNEIISRPPAPNYSQRQWDKARIAKSAFCFYSHALILMENGLNEKAMEVAELVKPHYNYKDASYNDLYIKLLVANKRGKEVKDYLLKSIAENAASPYMIEYLKTDYLKQRNSTESGFADYFNGLKSKSKILTEETLVKASIINQPIAPFNLESSKGGNVNLSSLKGKIVIIDFWATWCVPCKAAMPGMAMVVDKYKKDTNTAFFFISTLETVPDYKTQITKFLKEMKYPFEVLYDAYNASTGHLDKTYDTYSKAFHFSGIPQKMIIDANGKLRWRSTGYFGSPSALADEISTVIETLKKEEEAKKI